MPHGVLLVVLLLLCAGALVRWWSTASTNLWRKRDLVSESWRLVDVELHRRHDLVPAVVRAVSGQLPQSRDASDAVLRARGAACGGGRSPSERSLSERVLTCELGRLFHMAERCPQLRQDASYLALQRELAETQDRITAGRRHYNATVDALNAALAAFPTRLVARASRVVTADYFEPDMSLEVHPEGRNPQGRGADGPCSRGPGARGPGSRGPGARGPGARGPGARGPAADGPDARGPGADGSDARRCQDPPRDAGGTRLSPPGPVPGGTGSTRR